MKGPLCVREVTPADHATWNDMVAASPEGGPYSTPEYLGALCEATGERYRILAAYRGDELLGGVALYEEKTRIGTEVSPRTLLHYNGVVLRHYDTKYPSVRSARHLETMTALREALSRCGYSRLTLRSRHPLTDVRVFLDAGWVARPSYTYVVPLEDLDRLRGRIEQNLRRLIERCGQQGIVVTEDDDFETFFRMHSGTLERKGAELYLPQGAFERYFVRLRATGLARLYHARLPDGRSIGSQLVLAGRHRVAHTISAASDAQHKSLGGSAFLRFKVFEALSEQGYLGNDLTDAALNPVSHFKSQLGGDLEPCLVLEAPVSTRARLGRFGQRAYRTARNALRGLAPKGR